MARLVQRLVTYSGVISWPGQYLVKLKCHFSYGWAMTDVAHVTQTVIGRCFAGRRRLVRKKKMSPCVKKQHHDIHCPFQDEYLAEFIFDFRGGHSIV